MLSIRGESRKTSLFVSGLDVTGRDGITRDETEYVRVAWPDIYAVKYQVVLEILTVTGCLRQTQGRPSWLELEIAGSVD